MNFRKIAERASARRGDGAGWLRWMPWAITALWLLVFGIALGPTINEDSVFGLLAARDFHLGAPWNHLFFPDPAALAHNRSAFLAWWAPGQWFFPDLLHRAGLPLGWALTLVTTLAHAGGLIGWARLYRQLGYGAPVTALSLVVMTLAIPFWRRFSEYHGGEALLFGALPWIIAGALQAGLRWSSLPILVALFLAGGFIKLSFSIAALAIVALLWAGEHGRLPLRAGAWRASAFAAGGFVIFYGIFHIFFLSRGITPNNTPGDTAWSHLPMMPAGPLSFVIGGQQLSGRFLGPIAPGQMLAWAVPAVAIVLWLVISAARHAPTAGARTALAAFYFVNVTAIAFLSWRGNRVWFIDRIFMPAGLLLLPALVQLTTSRAAKISRWAAFGLLMGASSYSLAHAWQFTRWVRSSTAVSSQHLRHPGLTSAGIAAWRKLGESPPPGALAFYSDPATASLALEWPAWRAYVPAYAAIYGLIDGGPRALRGSPAAARVISFTDSPAAYSPAGEQARFSDLPADGWHQRTLDRILIWGHEPK